MGFKFRPLSLSCLLQTYSLLILSKTDVDTCHNHTIHRQRDIICKHYSTDVMQMYKQICTFDGLCSANSLIEGLHRALWDTEAGARSAGLRSLLWGDVVRTVVSFGSAGHVDVGVSVVGRVYLVALAEALDDVQVDAGGLHEAVLQQPAVGL